ncbi:ribosome small subunit-dependent GTPase A [Rossellomorea aquimaris]|uniref:ribosome small subunit-dependent GTPase A n=1 Tax=Rossellomorea aquimaris TaxID=189382 RepID=UPI001CD29DE6|nr:ribosome small subunit-dependent GTPase A [Rossellomorea aquimaris]MCA1054541.1 ribosome small subunit-dependent GTPase A [Rossellomorea aquimaris]
MNTIRKRIFTNKVEELNDAQMNINGLGRIVTEQKGAYMVMTHDEDILCKISGRLHFETINRDGLPAVGDWVKLNKEGRVIEGLLQRNSKFSRKKAGLEAEEQIIAANIDTIFILSSLNDDLNIGRLERYLLLCWESGANPVIVLTKADACETAEEKRIEVKEKLFGVNVINISSVTGDGIDDLRPFLELGKTVALVGSSGVGKSTLTNLLMDSIVQKTKEVRESDDKGRHTTTHRELFLLENGASIIDTPGMREIQLWQGQEGLSTQFGDIEEIALACKFKDCSHEEEPLCRIREAIQSGELDETRLLQYKKLQREIAYTERRGNKRLESLERKKWKSIGKQRKMK